MDMASAQSGSGLTPKQASAVPPPLAILIAVAAVGPLALNIFIPSMPGIQHVFDVSYGVVQLALTLYIFATAVAQLFIGSLSDRFGRRPVLLAGMALFLGGSLICAFATHIGVLIVGRVVQAVGGCAGLVLSRAVARDVHDAEGATRMIAYVTMAMVVAPMVAPAVGGYLEVWWDWRASFYLVAALAVLVLAATWRWAFETHFDRRPMPGLIGMLRGHRVLLRSPCFVGYSLNAAFSAGIFFTFLGGAPYVMSEVLGRPPSDYGLYFILVSLGYMLGNFTAAKLSRRVGGLRMLVLAGLIAAAAVVAMGLMAAVGYLTPLAIFGPTAVVAFSNGIGLPNALIGAISVDPKQVGTASGLAGFLQMGIGATGAVVVGQFKAESQVPLVIVMGICALLALAAVALALVGKRQPASASLPQVP
jgi:DHA1 family bicyclomycin/chloramphenicol resistance-like MFS transporter